MKKNIEEKRKQLLEYLKEIKKDNNEPYFDLEYLKNNILKIKK